MNAVADQDLADFVSGYIECALWSSSDQSDDQGGTPLDEGDYELAPETEDRLRADCRAFMAANEADLDAYAEQREYDPSQGSVMSYAGHDLWLTRNGHGAGFWDRGLGDLGDRLTEAAHAMGTADLYVGDDGLIYVA